MLTQIKMDLQAAIFRIWTEPKRDDCKALWNVATGRAVLHNRVRQVCSMLRGNANPVAGSDTEIVVVESVQRKRAVPKQAPEDGTDSGEIKNHY